MGIVMLDYGLWQLDLARNEFKAMLATQIQIQMISDRLKKHDQAKQIGYYLRKWGL